MRPKNFTYMLILRAIFLAFILLFLFRQEWGSVVTYSIIFAGSLFVPYLGKKEPDFYWLDCLIMITFILSCVVALLGVWPNPTTVLETIFSFDKIFHMTAGAVLAMFAAILMRKRVKDKLVFYLGLVIFALAIGGLWEIFEWFFTILPPPLYIWSGGYSDTMLDMVADTLGAAILAGVLFWKKYV